ncbi:DUF6035 family protein [Variovorax sp. PCZ-1]|uniref:DUF6035 family protein n=1 Tax=Variovorax sp. PCZ-1 TaxID=2835533 RepID=UPI001BCB8D12|nr:DUF6035 family protein [Variovorax sp. PCZ-1]MBS7809240.1 hypothetical protein [Variovorax sp. PCZ-1]
MTENYRPQQTVKLAIDSETGEVLPAESLLAMTQSDFTNARREAMAARVARRKGDASAVRYQCAICKLPLYLSRRQAGENRWFVHDGKSEDCPWYEGHRLTPEQIKALIYRGQQEGKEHLRIKKFIAHWLGKNPAVSQVSQETTTFSEVVKGEWRRPDVKCLYGDIPLVFEVQLSYTFLSEVIARDEFYRREGIFIIWVFCQFELNRAAVMDEAFFNRRNLFVLDSDAMKDTVERQALSFTGYHQRPQLRDQKINDIWMSRVIGLENVIYPQDTYRPYFFDYDAELKRLESERLEVWRTEQSLEWDNGIQDYLAAAAKYYESDYAKEFKPQMLAAVDRLYDNINWHRGYEDLRNEAFFGYHSVLPALLSICRNKPIGYKVTSVYQVIESGLRNGYPNVGQHAFAVLYLWAYKEYRPTVSDKNRKWLKDYAHQVKHSIEAQELTYRRYGGFDETIELLFPELATHLATDFGLMNT